MDSSQAAAAPSPRGRLPLDAPHRESRDAAARVLLAELGRMALDNCGELHCARLGQSLRRIWVQGYVVLRDGDDVIDLDDGSAVTSLDIGEVLRLRPEIGETLQLGRYISCICLVDYHEAEGLLELRVESACALDAPGDALSEPHWWLEVAEGLSQR